LTAEAAQVRPDVIYRRLVDGGMVYDSRTRRVHRLNQVAALIWEACEAGLSARDATSRLRAEYEVSAAQAEGDVADAIEQLRREGLLVEGER